MNTQVVAGVVRRSLRTDWVSRALCARHRDPDALFGDAPTQRRQAAGCRPCPVRTECLGWALDARFPFGVMGGMTERQRRALLKRRPDVVSWRALLETARTRWQHEQDLTGQLSAAGGAR